VNRTDLNSRLLIVLVIAQTSLLCLLVIKVSGLEKRLFGGVSQPRQGEIIDGFEPGDGPRKGAEQAQLEIVEFSDFACGACAKIQPSLDQTLAKFGDRVRLTFQHFPLQKEGKSFQMALAAECARREGAFWKMHDLLFSESREITGPEDILKRAVALDLEPSRFTECVNSAEAAEAVLEDAALGERYSVNATPTLFIGNEKISGALSPEFLEKKVRDALAAS